MAGGSGGVGERSWSAELVFMGNAVHTGGPREGQTGCTHLFFIVILSRCLVIKIFDHSLIFPYSVAVELTRD